jgi:hypothetical protein
MKISVRAFLYLPGMAIYLLGLVALNAQHKVPESIQEEARNALAFYPDLKDTYITFKFKNNIRKSTMQARPEFFSLFRNRKKRKYRILISRQFKISGSEFKTTDIPPDILVGWLGHELGHIVDYKNRSGMNLLGFGARYLLSEHHIRSAERTADTAAVSHGMGEFILKTKAFLLNHTSIPASYKERIKKYYLTPEEIMILVTERDGR